MKCQSMTMRLLKLQPAIWINVQKDSTCFHPSQTEGCRGGSPEIDTSPTVICLKRSYVCDRQDTAFTPHPPCVCVCAVNTAACEPSWKHIRYSRVSLNMPAAPPQRKSNIRQHQWKTDDQRDTHCLGLWMHAQ